MNLIQLFFLGIVGLLVLYIFGKKKEIELIIKVTLSFGKILFFIWLGIVVSFVGLRIWGLI